MQKFLRRCQLNRNNIPFKPNNTFKGETKQNPQLLKMTGKDKTNLSTGSPRLENIKVIPKRLKLLLQKLYSIETTHYINHKSRQNPYGQFQVNTYECKKDKGKDN